MTNIVRSLREKKGLSQECLALKASLSLRQLQHVEADVHPVPLRIALQIAAALKVSLPALFPKGAAMLKGAEEWTAEHSMPEAQREKLLAIGLDCDVMEHRLVAGFEGGHAGEFLLPRTEYDRLRSVMSDIPDVVVFETYTEIVALNVRALTHWQFLSDRPNGTMTNYKPCAASAGPVRYDEDSMEVELLFRGSTSPIHLSVEPDRTYADEDETEDLPPMAGLLSDLESSKPINIVHDEDGEPFYFVTEKLSSLSAPLECFRSELHRAIYGDD
jgi:transcriptional regulator with XRE-family HTH domain